MQASPYFLWVLALVACSTPSEETVEAPPQAVRVQEVRVGPMVEGRDHLAEVVSEQKVRILAQVPGTIAELGAGEGMPMGRGDLITRISAPDVAARGARAHAERRRVERERNFACTQAETDKRLNKTGDLPTIQLDRSLKACESARLMVEAAQAGEREATVAGTRAKETAPFQGEVLTYLVDVGQTVMPGMPLAQYGSGERQLRLRVVASDLDDISIGTEVNTPAGSGEVIEIGAQAQGPGRLYPVEVTLHGSSGLRVGETITATVVIERALDASAVPDTAIGTDDAGTYVLVEQDGFLKRLEVELGPRQRGWVAVEPTLPPGTRVVTGSLADIDPNTPVLAVTR